MIYSIWSDRVHKSYAFFKWGERPVNISNFFGISVSVIIGPNLKAVMDGFSVLFLKFNTRCHKALDVACLQSRNIAGKFKKNWKQRKPQSILKEKFLLHDFLAMQIVGQLIVNFIYVRVYVLSSTERIN